MKIRDVMTREVELIDPDSTIQDAAAKMADLIDDGRYTLTQGSPAAAYGTDGNRMVNMINTEIAEIVRAIKDERED